MSNLWAEKLDQASNRKYYVNRETREKKWKLPPGSWWVEKFDQNSKRYFYVNSGTREKTWNKPTGNEDPKKPSGEWKTKNDPNTGRDYYVNTKTFEKTWKNPNDESLPWPWIKKHDPKTDRDFYVDTEHRTTTWRKPNEDGLPYPWKKKTAPSGHIFYYNKETKISQWENPLEQKGDDEKKSRTGSVRSEDEDKKSETKSRSSVKDRESASPERTKNRDADLDASADQDNKQTPPPENSQTPPEEEENPENMVEEVVVVEEEVVEEVEEEHEVQVAVLDENGEEKVDENGEPVMETKIVVEKVQKVKKVKTEKVQKRKKKERVKLEVIHYDWDEDAPDEVWDEDDARPEQGPNAFRQIDSPEADTGETTPLPPTPLGTPVPVPKSLEDRRARALKYIELKVGQTKTGQEIPKVADGKNPESQVFQGVKSGAEGHEDAPIATEVLKLFSTPAKDLYLPQEYRLLPYDFRYHLAGYTFSRYGRKNFTNNHPNGFMFTNNLAKHPILLHFRKAENKPLAQHALNFNVALESFSTSAAAGEGNLAQSIATILDQNKEVLFGEAYCQIIRQLRNCPNKARSDRYWLAMICLLNNFLPSTKLQLTVLNFLASVIERTAMNEVEEDFIKRAKRQLARTLLGRRDPKKSKKKKEQKEKEKKARLAAEGLQLEGTDNASSAVPVMRVGDIIAMESVGQAPEKVWERQKDAPLSSRESIVYAQYAFFLLVQGMANNNANIINEQKKFGEKDIKRVIAGIQKPDVLKCSISESLFFQGYVEPNEVKEYFFPQRPTPPGLYKSDQNPLNFEWLTAEAQQTVPYGPDTSKKYALQLAEIPIPFTVLYLCWGVKKNGGAREKGIFLKGEEEADGDVFPKLVKAFGARDYAEVKKINCDDAHTWAYVLQDWITNLPDPIIPYTADLDSLLEKVPIKHESSFDNIQEDHYTAAQMECQKFVKKLPPLNLVLLKYLIRFFRIFLEPQFAIVNFLSAETLATGLATWLYGAGTDPIDAAKGGDRKSKSKGKGKGKEKEKEAAAESSGSRTREQKKAIYILNLLHTIRPTEDQEQLFASLDDYARQFDKIGAPEE